MIISELISKLEDQKKLYGDCDIELISITSTSFNSSDPDFPEEKTIEQSLEEQHKIKIVLTEDDTKGINIKAYRSAGWID
tara:strand:+ start:654 stop:893 length:240 start_codon:yes stop_codon:yes gene_type:complete